MSSYHIINAIWVGIFPMLAVMIIIGILFYFLCCINQIKKRIAQNRKRRNLKRTRLNSLDQRTNDSLPNSFDDQNNSSTKPDRSKLFLDLNRDRSQEKKINRKSGSAGDLYMAQTDTPIDCLVVQELNESPKSLYSRMQSLTNLRNMNKPDNQAKNQDIKQNENDLDSPDSYKNDDSLNDYDNDSSSSSFSKSQDYRKHFKDKAKKKNKKLKSKSSNQLRLLKYRTKSGDNYKSNRLSSDIDYGDELFNDDDSLSSTGFSGSQSKSVLFRYDTRFPKEKDISLNLQDAKKKLIQNSITLNSLNQSKRINMNSIPKTKSAGFDNNRIAESSSLSDMDPDDTFLRDILVKTPKLCAKKNVNFVN